METDKISFKKKLLKYGTSSHLIIVEKALVKSLNVEEGDWVRVTLERVDDSKILARLAGKKLREEGKKKLIIIDRTDEEVVDDERMDNKQKK